MTVENRCANFRMATQEFRTTLRQKSIKSDHRLQQTLEFVVHLPRANEDKGLQTPIILSLVYIGAPSWRANVRLTMI